MMKDEIINYIFSQESLLKEKPVLIDIGGSGELHSFFKMIEKHAIIITIDGDDRDFDFKKGKNIIPIPNIITDVEHEQCDFYLTSSPHCSSTLEPLYKELKPYAFQHLFKTERKKNVKSITLKKILADNNINKVDWFKTDSQGTDLRLFKSLPTSIIENVIVAEFEPGIIDAYRGEDKFTDVLSFMNTQGFWVDDAFIKGSQRMDLEYLSNYVTEEKLSSFVKANKVSPGWCEVSFINNFERAAMKTKRNLLLGIAFSIIKDQPGFALQLAYEGQENIKDPAFTKIISQIERLFKKKTEIIIGSRWNRLKHRIKTAIFKS